MDSSDEESVGIDSNLHETFTTASQYLGTIASSLSKDKLLYFYARYKQASQGPCNVSKPSMFNLNARGKWESWNSLGGMSKDQAMEEYISALREVDPIWDPEEDNGKKSWVRVSRMCPPDDPLEYSSDEDTVLVAIQNGDIDYLNQIELSKYVSVKFGDDMTGLHWAADRGHSKVCTLLIDAGFDVNALDSAGQTPLHYASSCGHIEVVNVLLKCEANVELKDEDGNEAVDVAANEQVKSLFSVM